MPTGPISLPQRKYDPTRLCLISFPKFDFGSRGRRTAVHFGGAIFAAGWWVFFDACTLSATMKPSPESPFDPVPVHVTFTDWQHYRTYTQIRHPDWGTYDVTYWGVANVLQNLAVMICTVTIWLTQNTEEYEYQL
ncbi:hypothetical protein PSTT_15940 [Puccinia striiformis]|uniref:Transmembrane protein n=1 Tax=Puccinia striiformis TaxID=27350 RepID=A0A2S4UF91_9BASI|nr:hypothetical protein PSTT_15940 [Puccinia striiformis]